MQTSTYKRITDKMLDMMKEGIIPWEKKYTSFDQCNLKTGHVYRGINRWLLSLTSIIQDYKSPYWITFKQCKDNKGFIRQGSIGSHICFVKAVKRNNSDPQFDDDGNEKEEYYTALKSYVVFNFEQTAGLDHLLPEVENQGNNQILTAEGIIEGFFDKPKIDYRDGTPSYFPKLDLVSIPEMGRFKQSDFYYNTMFHELVHSTGHEKRLQRKGIIENIHFGSESYSKEELIAGFGACFLSNKADLDIEETDRHNTAYLQCWIKKLQSNPRWLISASAQAEKACNYILNTSTN